MINLLDDATIGDLFRALARVEQKIRDCDPLFVSVGSRAAVSPQLLELAAEEQLICDELARRRADLRTQLEARLLAMQVPTSSAPVPHATYTRQE
jgi:hypothetical protein